MQDNQVKRKFLILHFFIPILCMLGCNSNSQILSKDKLIEDLIYLNNAVAEGHPTTLNKAWTNELGSYISYVQNQSPGELTAYEYENSIRKALFIVGCSHTKIEESPLTEIYLEQIGDNKYFPARCFADSSGLYILDAEFNDNNSPQIDLPIKVISINDMPAMEIINKLIIYQPVDGHQKTLGYSIINDYSEILIRRCFIGSNDFRIKYINPNDEIDEISIKALKNYSPGKFQYFQAKSNLIISEKAIELSKLTANTMYLKIRSMDYANYKKVNKKIFQHLDSSSINNLVIDLRGNGGGSTKSTLDFLSYILADTLSQIDLKPNGDAGKYLSSKLKLTGVWFWEKITRHNKTDSGIEYITNITYPKEKLFKGKIFILTDGYTASSSCTLTAYLKYKASAICIGQETAGGETGCNANSFQKLRLPNSKITISFPLFRFNNKIFIPDNHHGIIPDYRIYYTAKSYLLNTDLEMEKIYSLIN